MKNSEIKFQESEEVYWTTSDQTVVSVVIFNRNQIFYTNKYFLEHFRYTIEEIQNLGTLGFFKLMHPDDRVAIMARFEAKELEGKEEFTQYVARVLKKSGEGEWCKIFTRRITFKGEPAIYTIITDISDQVQIEQALRRQVSFGELMTQVLSRFTTCSWSEVDLEVDYALQLIAEFLAVDHAQVAYLINRNYWQITHEWCGPNLTPFKSRFKKISRETLAWSEARLLAEKIVKINTLYDFPPEAAADRKIAEKEGILSFISVPIKGTAKSVEGCLMIGSHSHVVNWSDSDITCVQWLGDTIAVAIDRKRAYKALQESEERYRLLFENAFDIILNISKDGTIMDVSPSVEKILGYTPQELIGKSILHIQSLYAESADFIASNLSRVLDGSQKSPIEYHMISKSGGTIIMDVSAAPILKDGEIIALNCIARDVTEQRKAQNAQQGLLEKTLQVSDLKSSILSIAAHELKTPLTIIRGWAELLLKSRRAGVDLNVEFDTEVFDSIFQNAERLNTLINDILDVGRIESGRLELNKQPVDFHELLSKVIHAMKDHASQKNIKMVVQNGMFPKISLDPHRFEQVLINLISNAIKYSPEKTTIKIACKNRQIKGRKMYQVQIIDEGYGFTRGELAEATEPFGKAYTEQEQKKVVKGTGLGLFISKSIVEQHGGTFLIRSEGVNLGTVVEILLPTK